MQELFKAEFLSLTSIERVDRAASRHMFHSSLALDLHTCVYVLQASEHLVEEKLVVLWSEIIICLDDLH